MFIVLAIVMAVAGFVFFKMKSRKKQNVVPNI